MDNAIRPDWVRMPTIFYIDDSRDDLFHADYVSRKRRQDIDLVCFLTADDAMAALENLFERGKELPRLLVVDLYMPLDSGLQLITDLRADPRFSLMSLGVCSGSDADEDRLRALSAGADFYLEKPADLCALVDS